MGIIEPEIGDRNPFHRRRAKPQRELNMARNRTEICMFVMVKGFVMVNVYFVSRSVS